MFRTCCLLACFAVPALISATELDFDLAGHEGFPLPAKWSLPEGGAGVKPAAVVVLLHGSGAQSMDEDLTASTVGKQRNLFFADLASALAETGLAGLRYHKRSYVLNALLAKDPKAKEKHGSFYANPLYYFVEDARAAVRAAHERFPGAAVLLLGHSEGTCVALRVAKEEKFVAGIGLIGFLSTPIVTAVFEQVVYRPLEQFQDLDADRDRSLSRAELTPAHPLTAALTAQWAMLDLDGDDRLSSMEFRGGSLSNLLLNELLIPNSYIVQETKYAQPAQILSGLEVPVVFFQGTYDNQTPEYHTRAIEFLNRSVWKKSNLQFHYYPGKGHALDSRECYQDLFYRPVEPAIAKDVAQKMQALSAQR